MKKKWNSFLARTRALILFISRFEYLISGPKSYLVRQGKSCIAKLKLLWDKPASVMDHSRAIRPWQTVLSQQYRLIKFISEIISSIYHLNIVRLTQYN